MLSQMEESVIKRNAAQAEKVRCKRDYLRGLDNSISDKWNDLKDIGKYVVDKVSHRRVFHVRRFPLFVQAIGSVKYNCSRTDDKESGVRIFFRGQNSLMSVDTPFQPTIYRKRGKLWPNKKRVDINIGTCINVLQDELEDMKRLDKTVVEGVIQHYGTGSRWIDAVDNIWTALWFACHKTWAGNKNTEFVHYELRNPYSERASVPYCYILLLGVETEKMQSHDIPGFYGNDQFELLDLRYALPSYYIRPHVQHGMLLRSVEGKGTPKYDMSDLLRSVIRIDLQDALDWLGAGAALSVNNVFPPPAVDTGYDELLRTEKSIKCHIEELLKKPNRCKFEDDTLSRLNKGKVTLQKIC